MTGMQERVQRELAGAYLLRRELGHGGMATVFLADDLKHGRQVALKIMHPETTSAIWAERFLREIEIAAGLSHPHIVPLFDSGIVDGLPFYVMPFVDGESLRARIAREKQLPLEDALRLTREVASALGHAHQRGLVHRDIKPENVLLSDGLALVVDFGIARAPAVSAAATTTLGTVIGTPAYMSPEQASGGADVDSRSDIYSLGCVLFEMLAGQPPFTGPPQSLIHQHLSLTPRSVADLRPGVPRAVSSAIARALAKERADRFASAMAFAEALTAPTPRFAASRSVAVLPFVNLGGDPENEYFTDGITEDVIAQLAKVRTLKVISRTSVMLFKKREGSLREIGARLGVATLLDGSVRRIGDRVRIVAGLIDVESDESLWSETYDRRLTNIFKIQADVALQIAAALKAELSVQERGRIGREPTRDIGAYQLYLQGRYLLIKFTADGLRGSIEYFQRAIERDPDYALAYTGLAMACTELGESGAPDRGPLSHDALVAAARALELDPELGEAHCMMAFARLVFEFDWAGAEAEFKQALDLSPGSADTYSLYGRMCGAMGRFDESIAMQERAQELDPLTNRNDLATALLKGGRPAEAARAAARSVKLDPQDPRGHATLAWALLEQGRSDEGIAELERAVSLTPADGMWLAQLGQAYAAAGETDRARQVLRELEDPSRAVPVSPYHLAFVHTGLGETERALDGLERAFQERVGAMYGIKGSFLLASLRPHSRFRALLRKMNLG
jgi:eukaryotic-like serine/threonine-protein kinase